MCPLSIIPVCGTCINSLAPERCGCDVKLVLFKRIARVGTLSISCEIGECHKGSSMIGSGNGLVTSGHDDVIKWKKNSASLAICAGNSPVPLSRQSWGWWFEKLSRPLWRHRNATNHYLSQCWLRPLSPYGVTRLHWIKPPMTPFITSSTRVVPACIPEQELVINIMVTSQWSR